MNHSFGFDKYVSTISNQISANFQKIDSAFKTCQEKKSSGEQQAELKYDSIYKSDEMIDLAHDCGYYRSIDSLSVGIFGEWGSGKTKLLKGIDNHFKKQDKEVIPIFFNAWRFEKDEHIIVPLFKTMLDQIKQKLDQSKQKEETQKYKELLDDFRILTFSLLSGFSAEGLGLKFDANSVISRLFEMQKEKEKKLDELDFMERIESVYFNIPQKIEALTLNHDIRFVFLIDDLDRCLPENTLKMLESIKLFLDIPGCAFVLAIDDDIVERGVEHHYKDYIKNEIHINGNHEQDIKPDKMVENIPITGSEYLEKMIQLPFALPVLHIDEIELFLKENYREVFEVQRQTYPRDKEEFEKESKTVDESFLKLFAKIVPPIPRKMIRTIEVFKLKQNLIDIDKTDLLKLIALELFSPSLFRLTKQRFPKQNIFSILSGWSWRDEEQKESLYFFDSIDEVFIQKAPHERRKKEYKDILNILKKEDISRVKFDLDAIFEKEISKKSIETYLHLNTYSTSKENNIVPLSKIKLEELLSSLKSDNPKEWEIALEELEGTTLSSKDVDSVITEDINITNEWLKTITPYLDENDFIKIVKTSKLLQGVEYD